jgi:hypothetical protein
LNIDRLMTSGKPKGARGCPHDGQPLIRRACMSTKRLSGVEFVGEYRRGEAFAEERDSYQETE